MPDMFKRKKTKAKTPPKTFTQLYHGIEIVTGAEPCEAAQAAASRRHLSDEAPLLPLEQCDNPQGCECKYRHFGDRRTDARRDSDSGLPQRLIADEKRAHTGRRITDD